MSEPRHRHLSSSYERRRLRLPPSPVILFSGSEALLFAHIRVRLFCLPGELTPFLCRMPLVPLIISLFSTLKVSILCRRVLI